MDFGALPPEINSGRIYAGPGPGPMLAAAAAWHGLASELSSAATSYSAVLSGLASGWTGPSAMSMVAAAAPYVAWMNVTAIQAEQAGAQANAAAAAYEAAWEMHVPPPLIAANRALLMSLIATNILGQNTPAIAATEAHYGEMWVQDAGAMYGYAGASTAASTLTPFSPPPTTTNAAALAAQSVAVAHALTNPAGLGATLQPTSMLSQLSAAASPATSETSSVVSLPASSSLHALQLLELARTSTSTPMSVSRYAAAAGTALRYAESLFGGEQAIPGPGPVRHGRICQGGRAGIGHYGPRGLPRGIIGAAGLVGGGPDRGDGVAGKRRPRRRPAAFDRCARAAICGYGWPRRRRRCSRIGGPLRLHTALPARRVTARWR